MEKRAIKFRAWDPVTKIMDFNDIFIRASGNAPLYEGIERSDLVLMQYTGLKDKWGKPIYEGDWLLDEDTEITHKVFWNDKRGAWWLQRINATPNSNYELYGLDENFYSKGFTVRGNIYENPELLTNVKR
jgi:uncharacterized phage protein (TIGR01671 family)